MTVPTIWILLNALAAFFWLNVSVLVGYLVFTGLRALWRRRWRIMFWGCIDMLTFAALLVIMHFALNSMITAYMHRQFRNAMMQDCLAHGVPPFACVQIVSQTRPEDFEK